MTLQQTIKKLSEEITEYNRQEKIEKYETKLSKNVEELSKIEDFYNLPLKYIFSIISKIDFSLLEEIDETIEMIQNIIKNIINKHFEEKETILILQNINFTTISFFSFEEILSILELIKNCPILVNFCNLYKEQNKLVDKDYEYEILQKDKEIEQLKNQLNPVSLDQSEGQICITFLPITKKPIDYEPDLYRACENGKLTSIQWLHEKENVDIRNYTFIDKDTPIHSAAKNGYLDIVQYLIENQKVDVNITGYDDERTALHWSCLRGYFPIVQYLLSRGANVESKNKYEETPFHFASWNGQLQIVQYLHSKGANIEAKTKSGYTPLHYACQNNNLPIVKFLISKSANIEAKDENDQTPLHWACKNGNLEIVQFLISKGANKEAKNKQNWTPLHFAVTLYNFDIAKYLIVKGANKDAKNDDGLTPMDEKFSSRFSEFFNKNGEKYIKI